MKRTSLSARFDDTVFAPYWHDTVTPRSDLPALSGEDTCEIVIIGAGFTGLWSALKARERHPNARIVVLEARRLADAASGRNGGFCAPSISHGVANAAARWPEEADTLVRLGRQNLDDFEADLLAYRIDAEFERTGKVNLAATPWETEGLHQMQRTYARFGAEAQILSDEELKEHLHSPRYPAGLFEPNYGFVNPARLVHGLAEACLLRGVIIHQDSPVSEITPDGGGLRLVAPKGELRAAKVVMATNADMPILRRLRPTIVPIFDYTIMTEPLSDAQLASIGWQGRYGVADCGNQFHYSRKTADNRILWGGYDAIYHFGSKRDGRLLNRAQSYARLETNFLEAFPSLRDVKFSHAWGGIIDTSARLTFFTGTAFEGRLAYALGFTGQGVTASRFAALTMLDLLDGLETERTQLRMSCKPPFPFPPEPVRCLAIGLAQSHLAREDRTGKRSAMLRVMDRAGIGFGS